MREWIEWEGGECPVGYGTSIDVRHRDGETVLHTEAGGRGARRWDHEGANADIVAYRLTKQKSMEEAYDETTRGIQDSALDVQVAGTHYKKLKIQPIEYAHANNLDCFQFNIIRYATRHKDKGKADDLRKLIHTAQLALEMQYGEGK